MKLLTKSLALILILSMFLSFGAVSSFASGGYSSSVSSFGDYCAAVLAQFGRDISGTSTLGSVFGFLAKGLAGSVSGDVCSLSDDGLHHSTYLGPNVESHKDSHGWYATLPCDYCGKQFNAYSKDFDNAYKEYSDGLPLDGYGSDGGLYWYYTWNDWVDGSSLYFRGKSDVSGLGDYYYRDTPGIDGTYTGFVNTAYPQYGYCTFDVSFSSNSVFVVSSGPSVCGKLSLYIRAPISGSVSLVDGGSYYADGNMRRGQLNDTVFVKDQLYLYDDKYIDYNTRYNCYSFVLRCPVLKIIPSESPDMNFYVHNTRVGSVNFNLATKQGDTVTNVYQNVTIVDEDTNIYTDPTTGEQKNINSWTYDYSTRTYHLTLEDGSLLDVEFGEDSIKVKLNGELTQEYYYTVENDEPEPTPSPVPTATPEPTPTPTPGGGGEEPPPTATPEPTPEPGTGGEDEPPDGFFEWLKQWLIDFKEWLGDWLDKLFHKDVTIDESDNSVHIEDNDDIDYDIYYSDDQGEQQQTSLRDILHKFGFLHDIYDLGRDMFTIVGADAAAAYAYDPGGTIDITPYLGDLRTVAAEDIMPIAGAPSLKMNLGAAQSHYGYEYGGEIEFLDLSWYTPYKQTVDSLSSGFLWILFIWHLFKLAPNIISGAGMVTGDLNDISRRRE